MQYLLPFATLILSVYGAAVNITIAPRDDPKWIEANITYEGSGHFPLIEFQVGNPPQKLKGVLSTSSWETWVRGGDGSNLYDLQKSNFVQIIDQDYRISYGGGPKILGYSVYDQIMLGADIMIPVQFGDISGDAVYPAVLGASPNNNGTESFISGLKEKGYITKQALSIYGNGDGKNLTVIPGGIDKEKYDGELKFLPWNKKRQNSLGLTSVQLNGKKVNPKNSVIFDTGSDVLYFDKHARSQLQKLVNGTEVKGKIHYGKGKKCEDITTNPIVFTFEDQVSVNIKPQSISTWDEDHKSCVLLVEKSNKLSKNVIGVQGLQELYVALNHDDKKIAVANSKTSDKKNIHSFP